MIPIALALLAGFVRVLSVILRRPDLPSILNVGGRFIRPLAIWLVVIAANAWPPLWPVLLLGLLSTVFSREDEDRLMPAIIDLLTVVSSALFSLPPLKVNQIAMLAILLPLSAFTLDWTAENLLAQQRVRRLYRNSAVLILLTGLPVAGLLVFNPGALRNGVKLLSGRFEYLIPIDNSTEPPYVPSLDDHVIVVDPDDGRGLSLVEGTQWSPYLEWQLSNPSVTGNPYDLAATVTFLHPDSGEQHTTPMFYNGGDAWHFRFTATLPGEWNYTTQSDDPDLDGYEGEIDIEPNPGVAGFVTKYGNKWGRTGLNEAFIPQFVMISGPQGYYNNDQEIDLLIQTFFVQHGFNGMHTPVFCRWFDVNQPDCDKINAAEPNPDPQTFEALEALITRVHAAGGVVHIWMWGDDARSQNPKRWGINGTVDQRLQRYIAARLGPLPGWTMGYGFDLHEWVNGEQLTVWHDYMHAHFGWPHYLGARASKNKLDQLSEVMDYSAYEQHKPDYEKYVETIEARPYKPSFSEDRFRIRNEGNPKDYNMEETRRGLWHSAMAGGVANIWGNLLGDASGANEGETSSAPYPHPEWIQTYSRFFEDRFSHDLVRCNELTDGVCLMRPTQQHFLFYKEDTNSLQLDLSNMDQSQPLIAVDTLLPYLEIPVGSVSPTDQTWSAPYASDWAIAVGNFGNGNGSNIAPFAYNGSVITAENLPVSFTLSYVDGDGPGPYTFTIVDEPDHGNLSGSGANRTYTPDSGFTGADSFSWRVNDGLADSNVATVTLQVNVDGGGGNQPPVAQSQTVFTQPGIPLSIQLQYVDPDNAPGPYTISIRRDPAHGTLSGSGDNLLYMPQPGFTGADGFTWLVNDGASDSNSATITVNVLILDNALWLPLLSVFP